MPRGGQRGKRVRKVYVLQGPTDTDGMQYIPELWEATSYRRAKQRIQTYIWKVLGWRMPSQGLMMTGLMCGLVDTMPSGG